MELYFVRHGETDMGLDEPLNKSGIQQAEELAKQLKEIKFDAIIASPLKRTVQTAEIINKYNNLPIEIDGAWRELQTDGRVEASIWHDLFDFDKDAHLANTEPLDEFFDRVYAAIDALKTKYKHRSVVIVSHGGVQHALYAYAHKLPRSGNARISPMQYCECRRYSL